MRPHSGTSLSMRENELSGQEMRKSRKRALLVEEVGLKGCSVVPAACHSGNRGDGRIVVTRGWGRMAEHRGRLGQRGALCRTVAVDTCHSPSVQTHKPCTRETRRDWAVTLCVTCNKRPSDTGGCVSVGGLRGSTVHLRLNFSVNFKPLKKLSLYF